MRYELHLGDNREILRSMPSDSVDSIVSDPPYELGFMGKKWDSTGIAYDVTLWAECLRVLKPGGHLLAFGGSRTYHRLAVAIEDAGFEIRDCIMWLYGSGFPKSHDVSKALDKQAGVNQPTMYIPQSENDIYGQGKGKAAGVDRSPGAILSSPPATPLAQQWQGWGTALKPAHEPIVVARKPLQGTVADNVTAWGVGGINVDGCRVGGDDGRWPANIILDEEAAQMLDEQSGWSVSSAGNRGLQHSGRHGGIADGGNLKEGTASIRGHSDSGGASRFFYVAKASKAEREAGLEGMEVKPAGGMQGRQDGTLAGEPVHRANHHPTVKPISLMRYLVRMVTPRGGVVLDPFMGSGTTGCAAMLEAMRFIGIDITPEYADIADRRIQHWASQNPMEL